jgi:hypothetical protein
MNGRITFWSFDRGPGRKDFMKKVYLAYLLLFVIVAMLLAAALIPAGAASL